MRRDNVRVWRSGRRRVSAREVNASSLRGEGWDERRIGTRGKAWRFIDLVGGSLSLAFVEVERGGLFRPMMSAGEERWQEVRGLEEYELIMDRKMD